MKKAILTTIMILINIFTTQAQRPPAPCIGILDIPDAIFKDYLVNNTAINTDGNTEISCTEADAFTGTISVSNLGITDLTGIEVFVNITVLNCSENDLTNLDISNNTALKFLICNNNNLTSLDVSNNTALTSLSCFFNSLTSLDVSNITDLTFLACYNNNLTSIDVSNNTDLTDLNCSSNALIVLNLANGNNTNLKFTSSFKFNHDLICIEVDDATYANANWAGLKDDTATYSEDCDLDCLVYIPDAIFKDALVNNTSINTDGNTEISCAEAEAFTGEIDVSFLGIANLTGIEAFVNITELDCSVNDLTSLDVSKNTALMVLYCWINDLTSLDVSMNTALMVLNCNINALTSLDVTSNTALTELKCQNNALTSLVLTNGNNLNLDTTSTFSSSFTNNPNLSCIEVDDATYANANWAGIKDITASYSEDCGLNCFVYIPDTNFKNALLNNHTIDTNADNEISCQEAAFYSGSINVDNQAISDLIGIEAFVSIIKLDCKSNNLTSLDISNNISLLDLNCGSNNLTDLDLSSNLDLIELSCYLNNLTNIDVSNNTALTFLNCGSNNLTSLDVSLNIALTSISCYSNALTSLDISSNTSLKELIPYSNDLMNLDVSSNTALETLICFGNTLTSLDVSNNLDLEELWCYSNELTSLDLSMNTALTYLRCEDNNLYTLKLNNGNNLNLDITSAFPSNLKDNPNLTCIEVDDATFSDTNWSGIKDITASYSEDCGLNCFVYIPDTNFKNALLSNYTIDVNSDNEISCQEAADYTGGISEANQGITDLTGIEAFINLTALNCSSNSLTSLDISSNTALTDLRCFSNTIMSLDISNNTALSELRCYDNVLTNLEVSSNTALTLLRCYSNAITSLDVSNNSALTNLRCQDNALTSLKLNNGNNSNLDVTSLTPSDFTGNPNLSCIEVDDAAFANANWADIKDATANYSEDCSASLSTNEVFAKTINLYPNPTTSKLTINTIEVLQKVELYTLLGNKIHTSTNNTINLAHLPTGIYLVKVTAQNGQVALKKILKQ